MADSVAAVLTVFNQTEGARKCVEALLAQTVPPSHIYVLCNGTARNPAKADGFTETFRDTPVVHVLRSPENLGNAGGAKLAMRAALADGADRIWIVEDDALPHRDALERLLATAAQADCVYGSLIIDPKTKDLSFPSAEIQNDGSQRIVARRADLPASTAFQVRGIWLGALIPRQIIDVVGEVNGDLFIRGEDEDYPARIRQAGYHFFCVSDSIIEHPGMQQIHLSIAGINFFYEPRVAPWKAYFMVRNYVYVRRKYSTGGAISRWMRAFATIVLSILCALLYDNQKLRRCFLYLRAGWHGLIGRLNFKPRDVPV